MIYMKLLKNMGTIGLILTVLILELEVGSTGYIPVVSPKSGGSWHNH